MIGFAMYTTIKMLRKKHKNKSLIARLTGHDWKTVAKRIKEIEQQNQLILSDYAVNPALCFKMEITYHLQTIIPI